MLNCGGVQTQLQALGFSRRVLTFCLKGCVRGKDTAMTSINIAQNTTKRSIAMHWGIAKMCLVRYDSD
ncbi:hypothetical protein KSD_40430 [Ktedonobacter sp. SOSP1-85]|nr:hypothetical protein KSD_40430 [Ktedonobacter sp. SOSP1-85]